MSLHRPLNNFLRFWHLHLLESTLSHGSSSSMTISKALLPIKYFYTSIYYAHILAQYIAHRMRLKLYSRIGSKKMRLDQYNAASQTSGDTSGSLYALIYIGFACELKYFHSYWSVKVIEQWLNSCQAIANRVDSNFLNRRFIRELHCNLSPNNVIKYRFSCSMQLKAIYCVGKWILVESSGKADLIQ